MALFLNHFGINKSNRFIVIDHCYLLCTKNISKNNVIDHENGLFLSIGVINSPSSKK